MLHPRAPQAVRDFILNPPPWLEVRAPAVPLKLPDLDPGESAVISLAAELRSPLMVDEAAGRHAAKKLGVAVVGAVGVLERAANVGLVADLASVHQQIRGMGFHVSPAVLSQSLTRHDAFRKKRN